MAARCRFAASSFSLLALLLADCGGSSTGGVTPTPPAPSASVGPASSATFQLGTLSSAAKSAAVVFSTGPRIVTALPADCPASPSCSISVPAPAGTSVSAYRVYVYPTVDGSGTPLSIATGDIDIVSGASNATVVRFFPVLNSYTLALSPATLTKQMSETITIAETAKDVTGATLTYPFVAKNGAYVDFQVSATLSDGTTLPNATLFVGSGALSPSTGGFLGAYTFSGLAPYPVKFTSSLVGVQVPFPPIPGYSAVGAALSVSEPLHSVGYALAPNQVNLYTTGTATLARSYVLGYGDGYFNRFDPSGNLWLENVQNSAFGHDADAYTLDGVTPQGVAAAPITMPTGDSLLSFDGAGRLYLANPGTIAGQPSVVVYTVGAKSQLGLLRTLVLPAAPCSAAADTAGRLYVALCGATGVTEYAPGSSVAIAANASAAGPVAVDPAGNVFATYGNAIAEWPVGTFGPAAPTRTLAGLPPCALSDLAVDPAENIYALTGTGCSAGNNLYYYPAGSQIPTLLQNFPTAIASNYTGQHSVATPLK